MAEGSEAYQDNLAEVRRMRDHAEVMRDQLVAEYELLVEAEQAFRQAGQGDDRRLAAQESLRKAIAAANLAIERASTRPSVTWAAPPKNRTSRSSRLPTPRPPTHKHTPSILHHSRSLRQVHLVENIAFGIIDLHVERLGRRVHDTIMMFAINHLAVRIPRKITLHLIQRRTAPPQS